MLRYFCYSTMLCSLKLNGLKVVFASIRCIHLRKYTIDLAAFQRNVANFMEDEWMKVENEQQSKRGAGSFTVFAPLRLGESWLKHMIASSSFPMWLISSMNERDKRTAVCAVCSIYLLMRRCIGYHHDMNMQPWPMSPYLSLNSIRQTLF